MSFFKKALNFYINSSIHVALGVTSLAGLTYLEFTGCLKIEVLMFIFFGTISGYNFVKFAGVAKLHHYSLTHNLKVIQLFSLGVFVCLLYFLFSQSKNFILLTGLLGFCTLLYTIPFLPKKTNLRNLRSTKIFIIAFVWAGVCVLLPLVDELSLFSWKIGVKWLQIFLFVIAITIPFELRDLKYDADNLGTLPQLIGIKRVKKLGYLLVTWVVILQAFLSDVQFLKMLSVFLIGIISTITIKCAKEQQRKFYASVWVEAIPILWFLIEFGIIYLGNRG